MWCINAHSNVHHNQICWEAKQPFCYIGKHKFKKKYIYTVLTILEELIKGWLVDLQAIKEQTFDLGISSACLCNLACGFWCCVS